MWVADLCKTLYYTGWHTAVLYDLQRFNPRVDGTLVHWIRPKNREDMTLPLPTFLIDRLPMFLASGLPKNPKTYYDLLARVGKVAGFPVNLLRFRHSACVMFIREYGLSPTDVMRLMGVTAETLQVYAIRPIEDIEEDLRKRGW